MKTKLLSAFTACVFLGTALFTGCSADAQSAASTSGTQSTIPTESRESLDIIEEMVVYHGSYGAEAEGKEDELLTELTQKDTDAGKRWREIFTLWRVVNSNLPLNYDVVPDGLDQSDALCFVVLGFQLNPDGSMREELIERLNVAYKCAEKYPNAFVICTGGGTASENPSATEAGKMSEWLINRGVAAERVIVEDKSLTTAQNAIYSCQILKDQYPQVKHLVIVSSDYHIATGTLLFGAESVLLADDSGNKPFTIVSNAAWRAPSGNLTMMFQAGALIELAGDKETAYEIYYDTYDVHELPPLG